jgi:pimeloyl-ACP methyl ester carboxylesterase
LSLGGRIALEAAQLYPERVTAVVHVSGAAGPFELDSEIEAAYAGVDSRDAEMEVDFRVWAPLGVEPSFRELWLATPDESQLPDGAQSRRLELKLDEITAPIFVVTAKHDPPEFRAVAEGIPAAGRAEVDSDHYLTLREPDLVAHVIRDFLTTR